MLTCIRFLAPTVASMHPSTDHRGPSLHCPSATAAYGHISCYTAAGACAVKSSILTKCAAATVGRTPVASSSSVYPVVSVCSHCIAQQGGCIQDVLCGSFSRMLKLQRADVGFRL